MFKLTRWVTAAVIFTTTVLVIVIAKTLDPMLAVLIAAAFLLVGTVLANKL